MVKKSINLKVFEIAIKKKDFNFLARHLVGHLRDNGWSHGDISELAQRLERSNSVAD